MKKLIENKAIRQFISYVFVGGIAAIVEWVMFTIFSNVLNIQYIISTCLAFIFSTTANWLLGRIWTFKDSKAYQKKKFKEAVLVFAVSAIGLLFNMGLMYLFVSVIGLNTPLLKTVSKILATGIVFIWNFCMRKFGIYRSSRDGADAK